MPLASIQAFKVKQQTAFETERERWRENGQAEYSNEVSEDNLDDADAQWELDLPEGTCVVGSHITGTLWKILVTEGQPVTIGTPLIVIEAMKMEFTVEATVNGTIQQIFCQEGGFVAAGQMLLTLRES